MRRALTVLLLFTACGGEPSTADVPVEAVKQPLRAQDSMLTVGGSIKYALDFDGALMTGYWTGYPVGFMGGSGVTWRNYPASLGDFACPDLWMYVCSDANCSPAGATFIPRVSASSASYKPGTWRDPFYAEFRQNLDECTYKKQHIVINGDFFPPGGVHHAWVTVGMACSGDKYTSQSVPKMWQSDFNSGFAGWEGIKTYPAAPGLYLARDTWYQRGQGCQTAPKILQAVTINVSPITVCIQRYAGSGLCTQWAQTGFYW